jgi:FixJ family two-component response regulator
MTLRFRTLDEIRKQFTEQQLCEIVTRYLDDREARADYHKKYNDRQRMLAKLAKEHGLGAKL